MQVSKTSIDPIRKRASNRFFPDQAINKRAQFLPHVDSGAGAGWIFEKINDMNCWISSQDGEFNNFVEGDFLGICTMGFITNLLEKWTKR